MIRLVTKSVEDTRELAAAMVPFVRAGDIVLLAGEMGSGKTAFAQGFGRGLGVTDQITSPTFTLMQSYAPTVSTHPESLRLLHIDVYRLDHMQEVVDLAITEMVDADAVALIEWGDAVATVLPADYAEVRLEQGDADDDRHIAVRAVGSSWQARLRGLRQATGRWAAT